jgi:hypothetical protein
MEMTKLITEIRNTADEFIRLISTFSDEQFNRQPSPESWTPGQVADHIIKATAGLPDGRTKKAERPIDELVPTLEEVFLNFDVKYKSPDFVTPDEGPFDKKRILLTLQEVKENNIVVASSRDLSALCMEFEFPATGYLTRYEWFKFFVVHTQRHIHQVKNMLVKYHQQADGLQQEL